MEKGCMKQIQTIIWEFKLTKSWPMLYCLTWDMFSIKSSELSLLFESHLCFASLSWAQITNYDQTTSFISGTIYQSVAL